MEFQFDENNAARNEAFLNKTKTQAKNLLKLAKKNQLNIAIENLSKAQEVLAQINGFPNWHALEKTIQSSFTNNTNVMNNEKIIIDNEKIDIKSIKEDIYYLNKENKVISFIELKKLPEMELTILTGFIEELIRKTSFDFNMGLYKINILINNEKITKKVKYENKTIGFHNGQKMDQKLFNEIFTINLNNTSMYKNYQKNFQEDHETNQQSLIISIETDESMLSDHIEFCKLFTQEKYEFYFKSLDQIKKHDYDNFLAFSDEKQTNLQIPISNIDSLTKMNDIRKIDSIKGLYAIQKLIEKGNFSLNISLTTGNIYQYNSDKKTDYVFNNNIFVKGLFNTLKISEFNKSFIPNISLKIDGQNNSMLTFPFGVPLYNCTDKEVGYYQPMSSNQNSWITLIFGKPGSGKSILLNALNIATTIMPGKTQLPVIGVIDIGPSVKPMLELLQNTLPQYKNKIAYHVLENNNNYIINPFDTVLGARYPNEAQFTYLINFLSLLVNDSSNVEQPAIKSLSKALIEYVYFKSVFSPKIYMEGILPSVDKKLNELGIIIEVKSWWEIVDILFEYNEIELATLAQRHAVPLLEDIINACRDKKIENIYSMVHMTSGENLLNYFSKYMTEALMQYKFLSRETNFDINKTDINVIDLDKVTKIEGHHSQKQTSVMYMIGRYLLNTKKSYHFDVLPSHQNIEMVRLSLEMINKYKQYHQSINSILKSKAISISYDEFHRANHHIVKEQIEDDMRFARIEGVAITIMSQSIDDFSPIMINYATNVFILDSPSLNTNTQIAQFGQFNFSQEEKSQIKNVHGPRNNHPGVFFLKYIDYNGKNSKLCSLELPETLKRALSSTMEDAYIRNKLIDKLGYLQALKVMKIIPVNIKRIIEQMKESDKYEHNENNGTYYCDIFFEEIMEKIKNMSIE